MTYPVNHIDLGASLQSARTAIVPSHTMHNKIVRLLCIMPRQISNYLEVHEKSSSTQRPCVAGPSWSDKRREEMGKNIKEEREPLTRVSLVCGQL